MKKLLLVILIITLPLITYFQYKNYRRFHPPVAYEYSISDKLDLSYHDYTLVEEYYSKSVEVGAFARAKWRNDDIDVRFPDENLEVEKNAAKYYNQMLSRLSWLEDVLEHSFELKEAGYSNEEIKHIESGIPADVSKWINEKPSFLGMVIGDRGQYVWRVQEKLIAKGYEHNLDGVFGLATQNATITFQIDNNLYPSGSIDELTFQKLFID
ncbi:peptidoglycan-binding domain-containing protein [Ekhidna sp.]